MDLNKEQQSLLMAITMSNGCSVPNKPSSDVNKLYASGYIDIIRKANGEFYEVTDAGRDKVDEIMSINKLRYDTPLQKSKCCAQKLDSISGLYNIFEQRLGI